MVFDIATLDGLAADIGAPVPNGDPAALFALADHIETSAQAWDGHADELARLRIRLRSALAGDTAEASDQHLAELLSGPDSLPGDSAAVRAGVAAVRNYAADLQDTQWTSRLLAAWLLTTTLWGAASVIATGGESLLEVAVAKVRTAAAINALKEVLWQRIATILTELLVNAGKGELLGGAEQLVVQGIQVAAGERTGLNGQLIAAMGLSFAEFGVGAEAADHGVLGLVADAANDSRAGSVATWATSKVLSGMAGNTVATAAGGGPITPEKLWTGAVLGAAGALADARGNGATGAASAAEPTDTAVLANATDTHPTLRFEKQSDGIYAWPGETTNDAGPHVHTASAPTTEPVVAAGEHSAGTPSHALPAAADPGARPVEAITTAPPAAADTGHQPATGVAAGLDSPSRAHASVLSHPPEGKLDPLIIPPPTSTGSLTATASPVVSPAAPPSNAVSPATPTVATAAGPPSPTPTSTPTSLPDHAPNAGLSSPPPNPPAGSADTSPAGQSRCEPAGVPAAGRVNAAAAHADSGPHDTAAEQATTTDAAAVDDVRQASRSEAGSHAVGRQDSAAADQVRRPAEPVTRRQDSSTRPDVNRPDPRTGPRGRPGKLRRSAVARDLPEDLVPAAASRAPEPLALAKHFGVIKAHHDDIGGPDLSEPQPHASGRGGSDSENTPESGAAGGGAADYADRGAGRGGGAPSGLDRPVVGDRVDLEEPTIIKFDPALLKLVDMGQKTTTIRAGHRDYPLGPAVLRFGADTQRDASIVGIRHTALGELTVHDAGSEGYATTEELVAVLRHYYPDLADTAALTIVEFRCSGTDDLGGAAPGRGPGFRAR